MTKKNDEKFCIEFEKKIRKTIRVENLFLKNENVVIKGEVNNFLAKKILGKFPVNIHKNKTKNTNKIFIEWSMDDEICNFLENFMLNKKKKKPKGLSFLKIVSDLEIQRFAKINKLNFIPRKKNKDLLIMLKKIRDDYNGSDKTLFNNIEKLNNIVKQVNKID